MSILAAQTCTVAAHASVRAVQASASVFGVVVIKMFQINRLMAISAGVAGILLGQVMAAIFPGLSALKRLS
ncbi:hypothetical protein [Plasticicumulans sp.]|uniref:hypothetical protein n=1 Tax=Plasticicumulans sp. TaxID=2307179 RepID=UPI002C11D572|nr:hypothetical protein [Plasticicumulans sp.]